MEIDRERFGKPRAGDAKTELQRRRRVVKGWVFKNLPEEECDAIESYLNGGPVPPGYESAHEGVR